MHISKDITGLIGKTPLLQVDSPKNHEGLMLAKMESMNPGGSVKDRLAWAMVRHGEQNNLIDHDTVIIEPTSGNTGIGLAMVCAARKYRLIVTMPESVTVERRNLIKAYGAEVVLTPADEGMPGSIDKAMELQKEHKKSYIPYQFKNEANAQMHRETTGPEIWEDTDQKVDVFVAGVGTGGTVTGVGEFLKKQKQDVQIIAVEPEGSPVLSGGEPGKHGIQGIGAGFVPEVLNREVIDEVFKVTDDEAFDGARKMVKDYGIFAGISSGAIYHAAVELARRPENRDKNVVFIVCDTGERYLSSPLYAAD
ncbi:Cysteine synthase [Salinivirga cyanobacteriivorans]|uniref:Cysteine synthase n=1 Tax=Salinivirga cyanobacteriivorans TaxID=1307839 RepID=A0A0S2HZH0_9BACT|nr:cysteine synthase A [Salinivirga cyanobacteriivorans]ALO15507.1 Cysteine synthase [Salinivirga cyanobacteriivorans]